MSEKKYEQEQNRRDNANVGKEPKKFKNPEVVITRGQICKWVAILLLAPVALAYRFNVPGVREIVDRLFFDWWLH
jgi:hypothetical protein